MTMLPGPVSKAIRWSSDAPAGIAVRFAIPPNILGDAADARIAIKKIVEEGNQRRAFSSGSHVGGTEVRDRGHAEPRGDDGGFAGLPCDGQLAAEKTLRRSLMIERLAVTTDQVEFYTMLARGFCDRFGVEFAEKRIQASQIGDAG